MKTIVSNIIQFQPRDAGVRAHAAGGGGGGMSSGGDGSDTEKRLSRLEASFENVSVALTDIRSDIRLMIGGGISGGVLLLGAIIASHLKLQDDISTTRVSLHEEIGALHRSLQEEISTTRVGLHEEIGASHRGLQEEIRALRATDDAIIERLSRLEINVAVVLARIDEREANRVRTPRAAPASANSPAGREALH
jgi:Icc-related predicted phosphoesterase